MIVKEEINDEDPEVIVIDTKGEAKLLPGPRRRNWWRLVTLLTAIVSVVVIIYLLTRPPRPPVTVLQTIIVTSPPIGAAQVIPSDTITPEPAITDTPIPTPTVTATPTETLTITPSPTVTLDPHEGEVNLLESNLPLPAPWKTKGILTYWEGYIHIQDELFVDVVIKDCGDDNGNGKLDILQIYNPQRENIIDVKNCGGTFNKRIETYQNPGYYRIFLQDNDTSISDGNGGTLLVNGLIDQNVYLSPP